MVQGSMMEEGVPARGIQSWACVSFMLALD